MTECDLQSDTYMIKFTINFDEAMTNRFFMISHSGDYKLNFYNSIICIQLYLLNLVGMACGKIELSYS